MMLMSSDQSLPALGRAAIRLAELNTDMPSSLRLLIGKEQGRAQIEQ
jgi:hypothetical protein